MSKLDGAQGLTLGQLRERAKIDALKPTRDDVKSLPGYWERPAKVHRTGVGLVDGYEWGVRFRPNDGHGRMTRTAEAIGQMMKPWAAEAVAHEADRRGFPGEYGGKPTRRRGMQYWTDRQGRKWRRELPGGEWEADE